LCVAWLPLAIVASAIISGKFAQKGNAQNAEEARQARAEDRELAERQFAWGQGMDKFDMQNKAIDQARNQTNNTLNTGFALEDRARAAIFARALPNAQKPMTTLSGGGKQ